MKNNLPFITIGIPTFNEAHRIEKCLIAIKEQSYPSELIEIIVVDANSTDGTLDIIKKYDCVLLNNEKKLAEPGLDQAYKKAKGKYMVFMAVDNILFDKNWLRKMVQPFIQKPERISASFSKVCNDSKDNIWNKYINEDQDPFSSFVFGNSSHPDKFKKAYSIKYSTKEFIVFNFDYYNYPLIALAQGTIVKTGIKRKCTIYDDIAPIIEIIKSNGEVAFVTNTCLYHYSYSGFRHLYKKLDSRIYNSMITKSYENRNSYNILKRKLKKYLFLFYCTSIIMPIFDGIFLMFKKGKWYMILHPIVALIISFLIVKNYAKIHLYEKN